MPKIYHLKLQAALIFVLASSVNNSIFILKFNFEITNKFSGQDLPSIVPYDVVGKELHIYFYFFKIKTMIHEHKLIKYFSFFWYLDVEVTPKLHYKMYIKDPEIDQVNNFVILL